MKKLILLLVVLAVGVPGFTQTKIGYVNVEYIIVKHPSIKSIQSELQVERENYEKMIMDKEKELQALQEKVQNEAVPLSERQYAQQELQLKYGQYQERLKAIDENLALKQEELMAPIYDSLQKSIDAVAKQNNYDYILSEGANGTPTILYSKNKSDNITVKVLEYMKIPVSEADKNDILNINTPNSTTNKPTTTTTNTTNNTTAPKTNTTTTPKTTTSQKTPVKSR